MESRVYDFDKDLKRKESEHTKVMAEALENATNDYAALEKQHHQTIQQMKDAEEKAKVGAELNAKIDAEVAELQEKMRLLEAECIKSMVKLGRRGS